MGLWYAISGIVLLIFFVVIGIEGIGLYSLFAIFIPYVAVLLFVIGFIYRVLKWASSPVPFHIPTVCGQQKSLPWIKADNIDSPSTTGGVVKRLALEILLFRSLLKNEKVEIDAPHRLLFRTSVLLWLGAMAFHWSFLIDHSETLEILSRTCSFCHSDPPESRFDLSESFTDPLHQRSHHCDRPGLSLLETSHLPAG